MCNNVIYQVASTHLTEEGNKEHKELNQRNLEEIEDNIVTDGVVTIRCWRIQRE